MARGQGGSGRGASQRQSRRGTAKSKAVSARPASGVSEIELAGALAELLEREAATAEILKVIASSPSDVQPVFDAIANRSKQLIGGFSCTVFRLIDGIVHLVAYTSVSAAADEVLKAAFPRPVGEMSLFDMAKGQDVFEEPDAEDNPDARLRELARARGFRSTLFARLMNKGTPIGLIAVTRTQPGRFRPAPRSTASDVCGPGRHRDRERSIVR